MANQYLLSETWQIYIDKYFQNMEMIGKIYNINTFWQAMSGLPDFNDIIWKNNVRFFKASSNPTSEHHSNKGGGVWVISGSNVAKNYVEELMMMAIGGYYPQINGVVINIRRNGHRLGVWVSKCSQNDILCIGKKIRTLLQDKNLDIVFKTHKDTTNGSTFSAKVAFTV